MRSAFAASILCAIVSATTVSADLWSGFYTSNKPAAPNVPEIQRSAPHVEAETTGAACIAAILAAEERHGIPDNLLLSIGIQEAGRKGPAGLAVWPWTVNANGKGAFFKTREEAYAWVKEKQAQGINSIDVGCMQINLRWHGDAFSTDALAFDPELNADYAARFLRDLFRQTRDWRLAAGRYHSATEKHQKRYLKSLERNRNVVARDFDRLVALARSYAPDQVAEAVPATPTPKAPLPPVFWAASKDGASYSIYSSAPLKPVLPTYREMF